MPRLPCARVGHRHRRPSRRRCAPWVMNCLGSVEHPAVAVARRPSCACRPRRCPRPARSGPTRRAVARASGGRYARFCASVPNMAMWDGTGRCGRPPTARPRDRRARAPRCRCSSRRRTSRRRRTPRETGCPSARAPRSFGSSSRGKCCASSHSRDVRPHLGFGELAHRCGAAALLVRQAHVHETNVSQMAPGWHRARSGTRDAGNALCSRMRRISALIRALPFAVALLVPATGLCRCDGLPWHDPARPPTEMVKGLSEKASDYSSWRSKWEYAQHERGPE